MDLSAKAAANRNKLEMESLFGRKGGGKNLMSSNRENYERQLSIKTPAKKKSIDITAGGYNKYSEVTPKSKFMGDSGNYADGNQNKSNGVSTPQAPSLDLQRRAELQSIMRDSSLKKESRRKKMEEIQEKYAAIAEEQRKQESMSQSLSSAVENNTENYVNIDLSAKSIAEKPLKELKSTAIKSINERMSMYNNDSTIVTKQISTRERERS